MRSGVPGRSTFGMVSTYASNCDSVTYDGLYACSASNDNIRLWNVAEAGEPDSFGKMKSGVQFKIIPGHHGGFISQMRKFILDSV